MTFREEFPDEYLTVQTIPTLRGAQRSLGRALAQGRQGTWSTGPRPLI